jgi:hypothetical protein
VEIALKESLPESSAGFLDFAAILAAPLGMTKPAAKFPFENPANAVR